MTPFSSTGLLPLPIFRNLLEPGLGGNLGSVNLALAGPREGVSPTAFPFPVISPSLSRNPHLITEPRYHGNGG
jgi:hypothetical protein